MQSSFIYNLIIRLFSACNVISMMEKGIMTLKNHGAKSNCSILILYPEKIEILSLDIGVTKEIQSQTSEIGIIEQVPTTAM